MTRDNDTRRMAETSGSVRSTSSVGRKASPTGVTKAEELTRLFYDAWKGKHQFALLQDPPSQDAMVSAMKVALSQSAQSTQPYIDALTPSCETKAAYMSEFSFPIEESDEDGNEYTRNVTVPWTTIKEIMDVIRKRAEQSQ